MKFLHYTFFLLIIGACNTTKYLQEGEALMEKNTIKVGKEEKLSSALRYDLSTLAKQQENKRFFFIPREWLYYTADDTTRFFGRWIQKRLAEEPTIFNETLANESAKSMRNYLISKGYYAAGVSYIAQFNKDKKRVKVTYNVDAHTKYLIDSVAIVSKDKTIEALLNKNRKQSLLKKNEAVSLELYNSEAARIVNYLRNNGYAAFNRGYIAPLQADSANFKMNVQLEILLAPDSSFHKSYRIGTVQVYPNYDPLDSLVVLDGVLPTYHPEAQINYVNDTLVNNIHFFQPNWDNSIKPNTLAEEIRIKSGQIYSQTAENQTNNNLSSLGVFRFIQIKSEIDSIQDSIIHYKIYLTRNQRLGFGSNLEFSYSDQNITQNRRINLIGLASSLSLEIRNALRGSELFASNISAGIEFDPPPRFSINTVDFSIQEQLNIPRFTDYFGLWKWIGKEKQEGSLYNFLTNEANTQIALSYNLLRRRNFYNYELFNVSFGYNTRVAGKHQVQLKHFGIDYFNPNFNEVGQNTTFQTLLQNNPFLEKSFGQQFFTSVILRELNYFYNHRNNRLAQTYFVNIDLEFSGVEVQAANAIYNSFALQESNFSIGSIDFSRYALLELDTRFNKAFNPAQTLAFRFNAGIGLPFGLTEEVPYVKQFYIGGPNSIRAFRAREVGPGSYCSPDIFSTICPSKEVEGLGGETPFYQTGNFKLELNAEYRFDMFKIFNVSFEGAVFLETGNVWITEFDSLRPNAQFRLKALKNDQGEVINEAFYRQLALGTGYGIRMDLNYFLIRLDLGYPLHTPYQPREAWVQQFTTKDINYNLALNYPF